MAKNKGGRPLKFKTEKELEKKINAYFKSCWRQKMDMFGNPVFVKDENGNKTKKKVMVQFEPYTLEALAVFLDCDRDLLANYEAKGRFIRTIKRAKDIIYAYKVGFLYSGKNPTGNIFDLKNNYGWKDKQEFEGSITNNFNDDQVDKIADRIARRKGGTGDTSSTKNTD